MELLSYPENKPKDGMVVWCECNDIVSSWEELLQYVDGQFTTYNADTGLNEAFPAIVHGWWHLTIDYFLTEEE